LGRSLSWTGSEYHVRPPFTRGRGSEAVPLREDQRPGPKGGRESSSRLTEADPPLTATTRLACPAAPLSPVTSPPFPPISATRQQPALRRHPAIKDRLYCLL
jgi:hypothetical protein